MLYYLWADVPLVEYRMLTMSWRNNALLIRVVSQSCTVVFLFVWCGFQRELFPPHWCLFGMGFNETLLLAQQHAQTIGFAKELIREIQDWQLFQYQ